MIITREEQSTRGQNPAYDPSRPSLLSFSGTPLWGVPFLLSRVAAWSHKARFAALYS